MAKKKTAKRTRTINQQLTSLERLVRAGFQQTGTKFRQIDGGFRRIDARFKQVDSRFRQIDGRFELVHVEFRNLRKEMNDRFTIVEDRLDRLATHVDGFMKLHETLDIEVRVVKEQMNRFEERLKRLETAQVS